MDLLYKYIVHKMYDFQFTTPALVVEKDAVFMYVKLVYLVFHHIYCTVPRQCVLIVLFSEDKWLFTTASLLLYWSSWIVSFIFFFPPVHLDGIMRRKLGFCTKTSQQWDLKIHLKILSQSLQYGRYGSTNTTVHVQNADLEMETSTWLHWLHTVSTSEFIVIHIFLAGSWQRDMCRGWAGIPDEATGMCQGFPVYFMISVSSQWGWLCVCWKCHVLTLRQDLKLKK